MSQNNLTFEKISEQKLKLEKGNPLIELAGSCRINSGIASLSLEDKLKFSKYYDQLANKLNITFFIPASGSGSRMFDALYDFIQSAKPKTETIEFVEHLISDIENFAFYNKLDHNTKSDLKNGTIAIVNFIENILFEDGLNFGNLPKGLIPFHRYDNFIINPFQEHVLQGYSIAGDSAHFHFTINDLYKKKIAESIRILNEITGIDAKAAFSEQKIETNAIAFNEEFHPIHDEQGDFITRPAGHGALLENLNSVDADLIFIRNIDNVQHRNHAANSIQTRKALAGKLLNLQTDIFEILRRLDKGDDYIEKLTFLNNTFDFRIPENKFSDATFIYNFLNRPIRICGMVKNEGQQGGGPFWIIDEQGIERRQIIEKSQISSDAKQLAALVKSTHFNPVEMVCGVKNYQNQKFDLTKFTNEDLYFVVQKTHQGIPIQYIEEPGLWNGGMQNWTTLFYEIDADCFSPVKTVLDLLKPLHR